MDFASVKRPFTKLYDMTKPRPTTNGNLDAPSYALATLQGATDGFFFFGAHPTGVISGGAAAAAAAYVSRKTGSDTLGLIAGGAVGAILLGALSAATGGLSLPIALTAGALLGVMEAYHANKVAKVRDGTVNAMFISGAMLPGYGKIAGGIASGFGITGKTPAGKAARGALAGLALGGLLGALKLVPGGFLLAAVASAIAGAAGPFIAPKYSQFFRNLSEDLGKPIMACLRKLGFKKKLSPKTTNEIGSFPAGFIQEAVRGFVFSGLNLTSGIVGGLSMVLQLMLIVKEQKNGWKDLRMRHDQRCASRQDTPSDPTKAA